MSNEIRLAFAHPGERSEALADERLDGPRDRISLRDYVTEVEIGAFQSERGTRQRVRFNIVVEVRPSRGALTDDVDQILSYDRLTEAIEAELSDERLNLLETLAERVADRILSEPQALRAFVRIEKLDRGPFVLGVEIVRARDGQPTAPDTELHGQPHPLVVYLGNEAIRSDNLGGWLDQLTQNDAPVILCVGAPDCTAPQSAGRMAQRRIDLLALEQNAWVLAGRDDRCVVVATRTELDWAMRNGRISVWAPSKIVLDAVDGPSASPRDAIALVNWFAQQMEASDLVLIGAEAPAQPAVPTRQYSVDMQVFS